MNSANSVLVVFAVLAAILFGGCSEDLFNQKHPLKGAEETVTEPTTDDAGGGTDTDVECTKNVDCDDGIVGTVDTCVNAKCVHKDIVCPAGQELDELGVCVPEACVLPPISNQDMCLEYSCNELGEVITKERSCDDGNPDTADSCSSDRGCDHVSDCRHDDDPTTDVVFDQETRSCQQVPRCDETISEYRGTVCDVFECDRDADCNNGPANPCVEYFCEDRFCQSTAKVCNDNNSRTTDACNPDTGLCEFAPIGCEEPPDNNPCTVDTCENGIRRYLAKDCGEQSVCNPNTINGECEALECINDSQCNRSDNACNRGTCSFGGTCVYDRVTCDENELCDSETGICHELVIDCSDRCQSDRDWHRWCEGQLCRQDHRVVCGDNTFLVYDEVTDTYQCNAAMSPAGGCDEGARTCLSFEQENGQEPVRHVVCQSGNWVTLETCGEADTDFCNPARGCVHGDQQKDDHSQEVEEEEEVLCTDLEVQQETCFP